MSTARILVVEDEYVVAQDIAHRLTGLGYTVAGTAADADDAVRLVGELRPALVLMDIRLKGGRDGIAAADEIRRRFDLPVIYLTAYADDATLARARVSEPFGYVLKPFDERELRTVIEIALYKHQAERRHREVEQRKSAIVAGALDAIVSMDADGRIVEFNPAAEEMFGYTAAEAVGRLLADVLVPPPLRDRHLRGVARYLQTGVSEVLGRRLEMTGQRRDGGTFPVELTVTTWREEGRPMFSGFVRDLTAQKQLEEQLRQAQKMEAIGQLAGGVAHDFNNLLTAIIGYARLVTDGLPPASPWRDFVEQIVVAGERAADLTRQLLAFSRKQMLQPRVLDLNQVARDAEKLLRRLLPEHVRIATRLDPELAPIQADPGQLEQILLNLAVNARDAMPDGGTLTVQTANCVIAGGAGPPGEGVPPGRYVELTVADTGCGMDEATRQRIFEPFFTTRSRGQGTGLGLATVYGVVKQSGGWIDVASTPGRGTTFTLRFPAVESSVPAAPAAAESDLPRGTETLLLVEDDASVRSLGGVILRQCGYAVLEARDGVEALEVVGRHPGPLHLVVTDLVMPHMNGRTLAHLLLRQRPELKVLFLSGYAGDEHGLLTAAEGVTAFLAKPFTPAVLAARVRELLDRR